jgi:hypothetical protein
VKGGEHPRIGLRQKAHSSLIETGRPQIESVRRNFEPILFEFLPEPFILLRHPLIFDVQRIEIKGTQPLADLDVIRILDKRRRRQPGI